MLKNKFPRRKIGTLVNVKEKAIPLYVIKPRGETALLLLSATLDS